MASLFPEAGVETPEPVGEPSELTRALTELARDRQRHTCTPGAARWRVCDNRLLSHLRAAGGRGQAAVASLS